MTNKERLEKIKECARRNKPILTEEFVQDAYNWKKETFGKKHADNLLDKQLEFLNRMELMEINKPVSKKVK